MKLIKLPVLMAIVTVLTIVMTACSSDEDMTYSDNGMVSSEEKGSKDDGTISVNFTLQDESGAEKYVFKEGENIIFRVGITNNSDKDVHLIGDIYDNDVFHVYSSKGDDIGRPFDLLLFNARYGIVLYPYTTYSIICPWWNNPNSEKPWKPGYLDIIIDKIRPLSKGNYYSEFKVKLVKYGLDEINIVTCKQSFTIE